MQGFTGAAIRRGVTVPLVFGHKSPPCQHEGADRQKSAG